MELDVTRGHFILLENTSQCVNFAQVFKVLCARLCARVIKFKCLYYLKGDCYVCYLTLLPMLSSMINPFIRSFPVAYKWMFNSCTCEPLKIQHILSDQIYLACISMHLILHNDD